MITFTHTTTAPDIYTANWSATFGKLLAPLSGTIEGDINRLRWKLRAEYRGHVLTIADQLCIFPITAKGENARARFIEELQKNFTADHVTLAREMLQVPINGFVSFAEKDHHAQAYELAILWANVLADIATSKQSLWVRGEIELLDGTILKPWQDGTLQRAA